MAIMTESHRQKVQELFDAQLTGNVEVLLCYRDRTEQFTAAAQEILGELVALSQGRLRVREIDLAQEPAVAASYGVERAPALVLLNGAGEDTRIRFFGAPVGYEFMMLLEDLVDVSRGTTRLAEATRQQVQTITEPVTIQVFSTPS